MCASFSKSGHKRLHRIWYGMKQRCYNKNCPAYKYYGGRGIKICDEWLNDCDNFYDWAMNNGFDPKLSKKECSIDRIDVNGNYEPNNCRWVNSHVQGANKRKSSSNISGYTGLYYVPRALLRKKWKAEIVINYKRYGLGFYATQKEALAARNQYIIDNNLDYPVQEYVGEIDLSNIKTDKTPKNSYTKLYKLWYGIKSNHKKLGIKLCDEWQDDFTVFYNWAYDNGYKDNERCIFTRIDPYGDYCPKNCKFNRNRQVSKRLSSRNSSGYVGISLRSDHNNRKKVWRSTIRVDKTIQLGSFKTQKEALEARNKYIIDNGLDYPIQEYKGEIGSLE